MASAGSAWAQTAPQPLMGLPLQGLSPTQLTQFEEGHTTFITPLPSPTA
ncbi:MAG: hypothetical protein R3E96_14740 [Planctomycetota bacterium]